MNLSTASTIDGASIRRPPILPTSFHSAMTVGVVKRGRTDLANGRVQAPLVRWGLALSHCSCHESLVNELPLALLPKMPRLILLSL